MKRQAAFFAQMRENRKKSEVQPKVKQNQVRRSLERSLQFRPTSKHLKERNILTGDQKRRNCRTIASKVRKIARKLKEKNLNDKLFRKRTSRKELIKKGVMKMSTSKYKLDPSLVGVSHRLSVEFKKNHLNRLLEERPSIGDLKRKNILHEKHGSEFSHRMQERTKALARAFCRDALHQSLRRRPSIHALQRNGVLRNREDFSNETKDSSGLRTSGSAKRISIRDETQACLVEIHKAKENIRKLKGWLRRISV